MIHFTDNGTDEEVLRFLLKSLTSEELEKAYKIGLIPKKIMSKNRKTGKTYPKTVWVRPDDKSSESGTSKYQYVENGIPFKEVKHPEKFKQLITKARKSCLGKGEGGWRVTVHSTEEYSKGHKMYASSHGDVFSITDDGDIVSVCKFNHENPKRYGVGGALLKLAIRLGGKKLDTYEGNFNFYVKCGLTPVSWCKFDPQYKPDDWDGRAEDIIFFKVGKCEFKDKADFKSKVPASDNYDIAQKIRDNDLDS